MEGVWIQIFPVYMIYEKYGVFSDRPDHFPQEFEPGRFEGREGERLRRQYFTDQKICTDCWNFYDDNRGVILEKLFPLYANKWSKWKYLLKDIRGRSFADLTYNKKNVDIFSANSALSAAKRSRPEHCEF